MNLRVLQFSMLLVIPGMAAAQDNAMLTGTVRDTTGGVILGAMVTIRNVDNGHTQEARTNSEGEYLAAALTPGRYDISVTATGFRKYVAHAVTFRVAQSARIDVTLQVGDANAQIVVQGEGLAQVNTQSSELSGTITGKEITQLQLNGRNFSQLVTLVPGVSNQNRTDEGQVGKDGHVYYSINGGRTENNNWEVNGVNIMDDGSNATLNVYPSIEAIQEVEVLTSNYGAQYGRNASGTVEVETKPGTNEFHGELYEFVRNEAFNAHYYFDVPGQPKAAYKKHDYGYNVGGPIWKEHTFFFWSQEWRRENIPYNFNSIVPSLANRQGDFTDLCNAGSPDCPNLPNNQVPSIDFNGAALMAMIPKPTVCSSSGPDCFFIGSVGKPTEWRQELVRLDHDFSTKVRTTFSYIHDSWNTTNPTVTYSGYNFPTIGTHYVGPGVSIVAKLSATLSPTFVNEFTAGYSSDRINQQDTNPAVWQRTSNFTMTGLFPNFGGKLPDFCVQTQAAYGNGFCEGPSFFPWVNSNPTYTYRDKVSMIRGRHNLVFGADFIASQKNEQAQTNLQGILTFDSISPVSTGNGYADLLMGNIANYSQDSAQPKYYLRYKALEPYVQDDFHVTARLTLNLGLRISLYGTFRETKKQVYNWDPNAFDPKKAPQIDVDGSQTGVAGTLIITSDTTPFNGLVQCGAPGVPPGCLKGHLFNPAPRIGFAWDIFGDARTSLRGGYGIFYDHTNGEEGNAETLEGTPPLVQNSTQYNVNGYTNIGSQGQVLYFPLTATSIANKAIWPYAQQWNLTVQRDLVKNMVASVSYVGSKGTHLTLQRELNQLHPIPDAQNPFLPGQPITTDICNSIDSSNPSSPTFQVNGNTVSGQPALNLTIACGNNPDPFRPYYSMSSIQRVEPQANSHYNALQVSLRKTSGALTLGGAYTYSHSQDNSSDKADSNFVDSYNLKKNYASSNFDQRHILTVSWVYDLPFIQEAGLRHMLIGGWQLAGIMTSQSGVPFSVTNGAFGDSAGAANGFGTGAYADLVGNPHALPSITASSDSANPGPLLYNPAAYAQTRGLTFGNSGRNSLNLPHRTNFDMAVYKSLKLKERLDVQFRAEGFNIFNHTQFSGVFSSLPAPNTSLPPGQQTAPFMQASSAHMARVLQFGLKVAF